MSERPNRVCVVCKKVFYKPSCCSRVEWAQRRKTCSASCAAKRRGTAHLSKYSFKKGVQNNKLSQFVKGHSLGDENIRWKGDGASYAAKHMWVRYHYGKPEHCDACGSTERRMYHWSNISGKYLRLRSDWQRLCVPCHKKFDLSRITTRRRNYGSKHN